MISLDWATPWAGLLALAPLLLAWLARRRQRRLNAWADPHLLPWAVAARGVRRPVTGWIDALAWLLLALAAAGPRLPLELPASGIPRTYRARTFGDVTQEQLESLMDGITVEGMRYGPINANMERRTGRNQWIELTLTEGKNREVRRVLEYLGLETSRLLRTAYGPFNLGDLPRGAAVEIPQVQVERFVKSLPTTKKADAE